MSIQLLSEVENKLLNRREVKIIFKNAAGRLTRIDALQAASKHLKVDQRRIFPISLNAKTGTRDIEGIFYIYQNPDEVRRHLPEYIFLRMLSKDDRKKKIEELKKARVEKAASTKKR